MVLRGIACSFAIAIAAAAQGALVVPGSHLLQEGTGSTNVPFGRSTPTRVQYAWHGALFPGPVTITAIAFRLDGGAFAASKTIDCELRLSTLPVALLAFASDFASNRGANEVIVLPRQLVTLPAGASGTTPGPFLPPLPLAVPFAYDPAAGMLVLEIVVYGQPPGSYPLDLTYVCDSPDVPLGPPACLGASGQPLVVESATSQVMWGRPWVARVRQAQPGAIAVLVLGTIEQGAWGGFVLPQELGPVGAPGCWLSIDLAGSWFSIAGGDGSTTFPFAIPNSPGLVGEWIRFQAAAFDVAANPLGLVTSQAQKVAVCGWEPVARLWSNGIASGSGTREIGLAAVVQFVVQ